MNFKEYQKAAYSTCTPECFAKDYLHYGLISEIGEFAGKLAKQIRGDRVCRDDIKAELGDIAWFIAVGALYYKCEDDYLFLTSYTEKTNTNDEINRLLYVIVSYESFELNDMLECLIQICVNEGFDFNDVLESNIKKLVSRKIRGKIGGNGDNR
jgi:NTP pyrophosphatase (non-canonical NTP hydrolase)